MVVKGSCGEKYTLDTKNKRAGYGYIDYPVSGSGDYMARIMRGGNRSRSVELEIRKAVEENGCYENERPLNLLFMWGRFAGFLYEGDGDIREWTDGLQEDDFDTFDSYRAGGGVVNLAIAAQTAAAVIMAVTGKVVVYGVLVRYMDRYEDSAIIATLHCLDYAGIPAVLAGILLQIYIFRRYRACMENPLLGVLFAMAVNLAGCVCWTVAVVLLMSLVMGAVAFIIRNLVGIVLFAGVILWIRSKVKKRMG